MWHSCSRYEVGDFFRGKDPRCRALYDAFRDFVGQFGPFHIDVAKTRIAFQGRVRFAGVVSCSHSGLVIGFWLKRRIDSPRFIKVEYLLRSDWIYRMRIDDERELDRELAGWMREAYAVGQQEHLRRPGAGG
jgi:hypothetical protein